jgi:two-component system sensor histidine kinase KdpD
VGVLLAQWNQRERPFSLVQDRLTEAFANQVALAIERIHFARQAREAEMLKATEALQTAILNAVSHDLRTPLSSITGVLSTLDDESELLSEQTRHELVGTALSEAQRLNRLVGNLLDISRIQADALHLTEELNDVQDLVGSVLVNLEQHLETRPVKTSIPDSLPLIPMDFVLISRALHNVIDNAIKYSPEGTPLEIRAALNEPWLEICVADRGPGLPPTDLQHVFDMFYRSSQTGKIQGTGLGLAISQGIVEAHGGRIWAENRPEGGLRVTLALPLSESRSCESVLKES